MSIAVVVVLKGNGVVVDVGVADFAVGFGGLGSEFLSVSGVGHGWIGCEKGWFILIYL